MVKFFNLLKTAEHRTKVLRTKPASDTVRNLPVLNVGIDKLDGYLKSPVLLTDLKKTCSEKRFSLRKIHLADRRPYIEIKKEFPLYLRLAHDQMSLTHLVSNPNSSKGWAHYLDFLSNTLGAKKTETLQINRLDLNIDFEASFEKLKSSLDFVGKRNHDLYKSESGKNTGITIGNGSKSFLIYDKANKEKVEYEWTRLELRLKNKKLPTQSIYEVPESILNSKYFDDVLGLNLDIISEESDSNKHAANLLEFKTILKREGFFSAKKEFNSNRNFSRDFQKLVSIQSWDQQPIDIFKNGIKQFFQGSCHEGQEVYH